MTEQQIAAAIIVGLLIWSAGWTFGAHWQRRTDMTERAALQRRLESIHRDQRGSVTVDAGWTLLAMWAMSMVVVWWLGS